MQSPGESFVSSSTRNAQLYDPLSPDERRGGDSYREGYIATYFLTVGARAKERPRWSSDYKGGKSFVIVSGEHPRVPQETVEQLRDKLITEKRRQLKEKFDNAKKMNPPAPDARLYTLDPEEWSKQYEDRWNKIQKATEDQWEVEDAKLLGEIKQSWEQYDNAAKDLLAAREEVEQAEKLARVSRIILELEYNARPNRGNIGSDTIEEIKERAAALRAYAAKLNEHILKVKKTRE